MFRPISMWGFPARGVPPSSLDALFHGKSQLETDDDWGYSHDAGNLHVAMSENRKKSRRIVSRWPYNEENDAKVNGS